MHENLDGRAGLIQCAQEQRFPIGKKLGIIIADMFVNSPALPIHNNNYVAIYGNLQPILCAMHFKCTAMNILLQN